MSSIDDAEQNLFMYVLARSRTRESSTLTIATVAASASLILFALYIQAQINYYWELENAIKFSIITLGVLFAIAGLIYRDVTALTIHEADQNFLRHFTYLHLLANDDPLNHTHDIFRASILRGLLTIPFVAWAFTLERLSAGIAASFSYILILALIQWCLSRR